MGYKINGVPTTEQTLNNYIRRRQQGSVVLLEFLESMDIKKLMPILPEERLNNSEYVNILEKSKKIHIDYNLNILNLKGVLYKLNQMQNHHCNKMIYYKTKFFQQMSILLLIILITIVSLVITKVDLIPLLTLIVALSSSAVVLPLITCFIPMIKRLFVCNKGRNRINIASLLIDDVIEVAFNIKHPIKKGLYGLSIIKSLDKYKFEESLHHTNVEITNSSINDKVKTNFRVGFSKLDSKYDVYSFLKDSFENIYSDEAEFFIKLEDLIYELNAQTINYHFINKFQNGNIIISNDSHECILKCEVLSYQ